MPCGSAFEEPRLADPRFAHNPNRLAVTLRREVEAALQEGELRLAADESRQHTARGELGAAEPLEPGGAFGPGRVGRPEREPPIEHGHRGGSHQRRVRLGRDDERVESRVRGALGLEVDQGRLVSRADERGHRVEGDRQLKRGRRDRLNARGLLVQCQRRVRRSVRGILDRLEPEDGDQVSGARLLDPAAEAHGLLCEDGKNGGPSGSDVQSRGRGQDCA